jgi:rhodanese-related sulfurtransferase
MPSTRPSRTRRAALIAMTALTGYAAALAQSTDSVSLDMAREALDAGAAVLIDIREPNEHARGVAAGARLLPLSQVRQRLHEIPTDPNQPVLLICNTQNRSGTLLRALRQHGYAHVRYVHGGMADWVRRGWPVVAPQSAAP